MRILILNWRDIKNPKGGGAEILTHEMAKRWVKWGNEVTQFSSLFKDAKREEAIDGVRIIRRGSPNVKYFFNSVHFLAFLYYRKYFKDKFDIIIDEIHGIPFFTPLYIKEKKIALICEVAGNIWDVVYKFPQNKIGRLAEDTYFNFYKNIPFLTISPSTAEDLIRKGIKKSMITVLPMGITVPEKLKNFSKEKDPTLIFVGRLIRTKGIEDAIIALSKISEKEPTVKLWIVGRGDKEYEGYLKNLSEKVGVSQRITSFGYVTEEKKFELMSRASLLVAPSMKEGWGLIVAEAALVNTPSVVYNVPGLQDVVKDGDTGIITSENSSLGLASAVFSLLKNRKKYNYLQTNSFHWAKSLTWDDTARKSLIFLTALIDRR